MCYTCTNEYVHVKKTEVKAASVIKSLTLFLSAVPPKRSLLPCVTAAGSGRVWTSLNSKESNMKVPSCGAVAVEQNGEEGGWRLHPAAGHGHGHGHSWGPEANLASHPVGAVLSQAQRWRDHPH